ncbi:V-type ATP synthase subunit C [Halostella sp. JP-L12]|uniref:V-type ATP synthase subunit C n=1 Tax=Halostella TaxID=1843185 RepID=UPI000EF84256|nr:MULTISPECIES: V-type ATP synthase subunit C [Halostella]NHN46716.1 V-type ATP synthase subunit C [Halostella sp. JP-L12]
MSATGTNPEYVNARVRARRAKLFSDEDYRKLVRMGPSEIARFMEETEYESEINALGSRHSGVDLIEYALNRNMAKHFDDLLRWSGGEMYDRIASYLRKFDAWNVKTSFRGLYSGASAEEIETDYIRAGEFDDRFLERLANAGTIEDAVELLDGTIFGDGLVEAFEEYEESGVLVPLENVVDRAFYENLLGDISGADEPTRMYVEFLQAEIDFRNVRNGLRLARSGADMDPSEYYIEGGQLFTANELSRLVGSRDQLVSQIRDSKYEEELSDALDEIEEVDSLIGFEHALDRALLEYSRGLSNRFPNSICPVLAYVLAKEREVENVRAVARGKEAGLTEEEVNEELVIV